jgi:gas vesicle protein
VLVGVVIGAAAAFFLDPANGSARRAKLPGGSSAPAESAAYTPPTAAATEPPRTPVA